MLVIVKVRYCRPDLQGRYPGNLFSLSCVVTAAMPGMLILIIQLPGERGKVEEDVDQRSPLYLGYKDRVSSTRSLGHWVW